MRIRLLPSLFLPVATLLLPVCIHPHQHWKPAKTLVFQRLPIVVVRILIFLNIIWITVLNYFNISSLMNHMRSSLSRLPADGDILTIIDGWIIGVISDHLDLWLSDPTHLLVQPLELPVFLSLPSLSSLGVSSSAHRISSGLFCQLGWGLWGSALNHCQTSLGFNSWQEKRGGLYSE